MTDLLNKSYKLQFVVSKARHQFESFLTININTDRYLVIDKYTLFMNKLYLDETITTEIHCANNSGL